MEIKPPLEYDNFFHIYNRGINSCDIFDTEQDYFRFFELYNVYISSIADTYAWCLMSNHFHLLVRIKDLKEIGFLIPENKKLNDYRKWLTFFPDSSYSKEQIKLLKKPTPERQFSHLFNTYTKWFNKKYSRTGKLVEERFERIKINDEKYLKELVFYIHNNPVHHKVTAKIDDYYWTSYLTIISKKTTKLHRETVIEWFDNIENFKYHHQKDDVSEDINNLIFD